MACAQEMVLREGVLFRRIYRDGGRGKEGCFFAWFLLICVFNVHVTWVILVINQSRAYNNYLSIYLSDLSMFVSIYLSIYLYIYLCMYLSIYLWWDMSSIGYYSVKSTKPIFNYLSIYLYLISMYISIYLSMYVSIYLSMMRYE